MPLRRRALSTSMGTSEYILDLNELVAMFPEDQRRKFIGDNARALFKLE